VGSRRQTVSLWNVRKGHHQENLIFAMPPIGRAYGITAPALHLAQAATLLSQGLHDTNTRIRQSSIVTASGVKAVWCVDARPHAPRDDPACGFT
jgi:hypothetical protein